MRRPDYHPLHEALILLLLAGACYVFFFHGLSNIGLLGPDEPRYASVAREMFLMRAVGRRRCQPDRVFGLVVKEAPPRARVATEDHGPVALRRNHVQAVIAGRESLSANLDGRRERDDGVLVRARAPDLVERYDVAPDRALSDSRPVVRNRDVGQADPL